MEEQELKQKLNPEQYRVMREDGAESPHTGKYWDHFKKGVYTCAACGAELFSSRDKFNSKTGWPTFYKPIDEHTLEFKGAKGNDKRAEFRCKKCKSHLGYVVADATRPYYRANSIGLEFEERADVLERLEAVKDKVDQAQDAKDKIDTITQQSNDDAQHIQPQTSWGQSAAAILAGVLIGAGALAGLTYAGVTKSLCPVPPAAASTAATSTASNAAAATTTSQVKPKPKATTTPVRATTTPAMVTASSSTAGTATTTP